MTREEARRKAAALVAKMTVEEAAGQLRYNAPAIDRLGVPAYNWWNEALHGVARDGMATSFPQAIGMAATFDRELVRELGDIVSTEGRAKYNALSARGDRDIYKGLTFWSPNINIFRDPRWGRGHETYGEDPYLTGEIGKAYVRGIQGQGDTLKAAACAKHFAVHSGPETMRHVFNAVVSKKDMAETYLPAFRELVTKADVEAVMGAYNRTNGEPCNANHFLMEETLRGKWKFEGHYVSDCGAIRDFHEGHKVTACPEESVTLALKTGCDVNCGCTYQYVLKAYEKGMITQEDIRRAATRLFTTRFLLGLFDGSEYDDIPYSVVECPEHIAKARRATGESCVLLKNDGLLPLKKEELTSVAVIGPNANSRTALIGNYHGTSSRYITVLEGLQDALGESVRVYASTGCHLYKDHEEYDGMPGDRISEAVTVAGLADAVVLVVGLDETLEGEEGDAGNGDKPDLLLPESQRALVDKVIAVGKPTVIVLMAGSAIDLGEAAERANAVLLTWYPGARGGAAVADILLGNVSPSGKLPVTFYQNDDLAHMPAFTDYAMKGRTYRYLSRKPVWPFGYGLTYGDTRVVSAEATRDGEDIIVKACVCNEGGRDTEDVVQVYAQNEGSVHAPDHARLCGFERILIPAGESVTTVLTVPGEMLKVVNDEGEAVSEGDITLCIGMGQPDERTAELTGHASLAVKI